MEPPIIQQGDELGSHSVDETAVQNGLPLASSSFFLKVKTVFKPSSFTCQCPRGDVDYCCERARGWLTAVLEKEQLNNKKPNITQSQLESMRQSYTQLTRTRELSDYEDQICKDLGRTFPRAEQFKDEAGLEALKRVLLAYSRYDKSVGYVQGMNFIAGQLLYHCQEEIAFWIFATLIESFELRHVFERHLPGLYRHGSIIDGLLRQQEPELHGHLQELGVLVEMYASDWVICLFASLVPLHLYADFLDAFFARGWLYFYTVCLCLLRHFKRRLLEQDEIAGVLYHIKFKSLEKRAIVFNEATGEVEKPGLLSKLFEYIGRRLQEESAEEVWKQVLKASQQGPLVEGATVQQLERAFEGAHILID